MPSQLHYGIDYSYGGVDFDSSVDRFDFEIRFGAHINGNQELLLRGWIEDEKDELWVLKISCIKKEERYTAIRW